MWRARRDGVGRFSAARDRGLPPMLTGHSPLAAQRSLLAARSIEDLKEANVWTVGLDERSKQTYYELDYKMDCALVLGGEGKGLHDLVKRKCDFLVSIPMLGKVPSLNVSVAAAVVLFEIVRQRRARNAASISAQARP